MSFDSVLSAFSADLAKVEPFFNALAVPVEATLSAVGQPAAASVVDTIGDAVAAIPALVSTLENDAATVISLAKSLFAAGKAIAAPVVAAAAPPPSATA